MSVGQGRIEKSVLKVLEYERQQNDGNLGKTIGEVDGKTVYFECDSTVKDVAYRIVNGCNDKDGVYDEENLGKVYRSIYQSVCRAIRNLERKGFLKTTIVPGGDISGYGWAKAVTLVKSGDKHLNMSDILAWQQCATINMPKCLCPLFDFGGVKCHTGTL